MNISRRRKRTYPSTGFRAACYSRGRETDTLFTPTGARGRKLTSPVWSSLLCPHQLLTSTRDQSFFSSSRAQSVSACWRTLHVHSVTCICVPPLKADKLRNESVNGHVHYLKTVIYTLKYRHHASLKFSYLSTTLHGASSVTANP
jgi:hypothetical protein